MNIMKTNMLLLDNRIRKDEGDNTATVAAPVPSTVKPYAGMKALMFQGMQNLMANPALAKEVGVMNDDNAEDKSSAPSNVAFQGRLGNAATSVKSGVKNAGRKLIPGMLLLSTLLPAALTSCTEKEYISVPAKEFTNTVNIEIDMTAVTALVTMMQTTLTQMLLQQQLSYEQFQQYMNQMTAWQQQMTDKVNSMDQKLATIQAVLLDMGENIIDIENGVKEGNALQQLVINLLTQNGMSLSQANIYLQTLINEVKEGKKSVTQAMAEIIEQLNLVNKNLDTVISNQDRAYEQQKEVITLLKGIKGNTQEAKEAAKLANTQLYTINSTIIDGNKQVVSSINTLDGDLKAGIAYIAQTVGWSTSQVIAYMNKLGINIQNSNAWNASMIIAAINYNTHVTEKGNKTLAEFKAEFEAGLITAEQYAQAMLGVLNDINSKVGTLIDDFNTYAADMKKEAQHANAQLAFGNMTAVQANGLLTGIYKNQQKAYAMLEVMNQNIEQIDVDMNAGIDMLAAKLGCSTAQIIGMLQWLGYSEAQISSMNTAAIINAIKTATDKTINELGDKLDGIKSSVDKVDYDLNNGLKFISAQIGYSTNQIVGMLQWLGYSNAQISSMNTAAVINALKNSTEIIGGKIDNVADIANQINIDQNANHEELLEYLHCSKEQLFALMEFLGYSQAQVMSMSAGAIVNAIKTSTNIIDNKIDQAINSIDKLDNDMNNGLAFISAQIGCSTSKIINILQALGYSQAQISTMNTAAIINAIKNASGMTIGVIGDKLDAILNKIGDGNNTLTQEEIDEILALLQSIDQGIVNNGNKIDDLTETVKALIAKIDSYAKAALNALNNQNSILADIKGDINNIGSKLNYLVQKANDAEKQRQDMLVEIRNLKTQISQLNIEQGGITVQELDQLLDVYAKKLIAAINVNPADFTTIEGLLADIDAKMDYQAQSNQILLDILAAVKKLDKNSPDYNAKLDQIIELMKNFKFECNCKHDCDNNNTIHEGIIDVIS